MQKLRCSLSLDLTGDFGIGPNCQKFANIFIAPVHRHFLFLGRCFIKLLFSTLG